MTRTPYNAPSKKALLEAFSHLTPENADLIRKLIRGEVSTYTVPAVKSWVEECYNPPSRRERIMCALNALIEGYGVELLDPSDAYGCSGSKGEYVNMGDTYAATIIYSAERSTFRIDTWGRWVESWEKRHARLA